MKADCNELIPVVMTWLPIETALGPVMAWGKGPASFQDEPPSTRISDESMIPYKMKYNLSRRQVILVFHFYFQANVICANLNVARFYCCFVLAFCLSIVKSIIKWCSTHNQIYLTRRDYIIYLSKRLSRLDMVINFVSPLCCPSWQSVRMRGLISPVLTLATLQRSHHYCTPSLCHAGILQGPSQWQCQ